MALLRLQFTPSPHVVAFITFFVWYLILVHDVRHWSYRDPSSAFFDPERAFERQYSLIREAEAESYVEAAEEQNYVKAAPDPYMCVGIATVQREGARYFRRTVGSVLANLTDSERSDIYLLSFIANSDPYAHEAYGENWLNLLSDDVLTYQDAEDGVVEHVKELEMTDPQFDRKPLYDYIHLLRHCYDMETPYIVMLEDDVIGAEGWFYRTKEALTTLEEQRPKMLNNTLYLRLFYNERIRGWNSEELPSYIMRVILIECAVTALLLLALFLVPYAGTVLTPLTVATLILIVTPMSIALYFWAGRMTVAPLAYGLNRMETYGCCSQAFVFPRHQIPSLIKYYEEAGSGKLDVLTEEYANDNHMVRWALTPSVFAHVGSTSSKSSFPTKWGRTNTENIWNFSFELQDPEELKDEHL